MQRYIVLLAISWLLNLVLFEPLMLILHLFVGEPSVDEPWAEMPSETRTRRVVLSDLRTP